MYFGRHGPFFSFWLGVRPFGFAFWRPGTERRYREEYLRALEEYRADLERELRAVDEELASLRREQGGASAA